MKKVKVLIITEVFFPEIGSGANRLNNLVVLLKKKGYSVDVLTSNPSYPNSEMYEDNSFWSDVKKENIYNESNIFRVNSSKVKKSESFLNRLYIYIVFLFNCVLKLFKIRGKYNIVISTTPSIFNGVVGVLAKYKFRAKYILDIRDLWPECLKEIGVFRRSKIALKLAYTLEKIILKFPDALMINSDGFRPYLEKNKFKRPIIFVPNSLTEDEILEYKKIEESAQKHEEFVIVYTGMIGLPQNIRSIVKAANQLRVYSDIKFKIIGDGIQKEKVEELIKYYGITNIEVYDPIPKSDVIKEVSKCSVAIAHLRSDSGFDIVIPGKIIDYMGIGIPIIAGVRGYTAKIINDSNCGVVIEPDNYKMMAEEIKNMYEKHSMRNYYKNCGREYCKSEFLWENNINKVDDLIEVLLRGEENVKKNMYDGVESFH